MFTIICKHHDRPVWNSNITDLVCLVTDQCVFCSVYGTRAIEPNSRQCFRLGTQYTMKHMLRHSYIVFICVSHSLRQFMA